jgi:hypothetical protein
VSATVRTVSGSLKESSSLQSHVQSGLGAFIQAHRGLIAVEARERITQSLDLDRAAQASHPSSPRWDYIVSTREGTALTAVEPHAASDHEIPRLIQKQRWAKEFLRTHLKASATVSRWIWVTEGRVGFSRMDRLRRTLDKNGIEFAGRVLKSL